MWGLSQPFLPPGPPDTPSRVSVSLGPAVALPAPKDPPLPPDSHSAVVSFSIFCLCLSLSLMLSLLCLHLCPSLSCLRGTGARSWHCGWNPGTVPAGKPAEPGPHTVSGDDQPTSRADRGAEGKTGRRPCREGPVPVGAPPWRESSHLPTPPPPPFCLPGAACPLPVRPPPPAPPAPLAALI